MIYEYQIEGEQYFTIISFHFPELEVLEQNSREIAQYMFGRTVYREGK